ncbi:protein lin-28 homolog isoform X2 [Acanthaster planci]|uniref:Protein lin-28 homolog isoform X2 n=1 Tax=Acanthaster planci TaxID=133434 RepID=A0A8B7YE39_ACAPL|nr:protein lin-28 homolog isoform X2 [Acanthaster planci]XP_022089902.1 protein lin-28 homolog isoform X2 [Acanthaster planci]
MLDGTGDEVAAAASAGTPGSRASPTAEEGKLCCGRCKWFDVSKGYGFITPDDKSGDVFVYQSSIQMSGFRSLDLNEEVEFVFKISDKGREAVSVTGPGCVDCKGSKRRGRGSRRRDDRCYNCNERGHHAKNCPEPPLPKRCHHCKSEDHLVADCPDKPAPSSQGNGAKPTDVNGDSTGEPRTSATTSAAATSSDSGGTS